MLNKAFLSTFVCLAAVLLLFTFRAGGAQQESAVYYAETGHYVAPPFLSAFQAAGYDAMWGPPVTEPFEENGLLVQYFQRTRLECPQQAQELCEPALSPLGEMMAHQTPRATCVPDALIDDGLCRHFPETGHNVCFSFLSFYLEHGGPEMFGPPISELTVESGNISQCFRKACMVWDVQAPAHEAMRLAPLGLEYFEARALEPSLLAAVESPGELVATPAHAEIAVGSLVRVVDTEGAGLRMRDGPGLGYYAVETLEEGTILSVTGGPQTADDFTWWQVQTDGATGWCASDWLALVDSSAVR